MKNKRKPIYDWDEETGVATCFLFDKNNTFIGIALCHSDDEDFKSEKTGLFIAESRARIKMLQHIRNNELKPELAGLKQLYYSINKSKHYNKKSYEAKMLWRQMKNKERDIKILSEIIYKERMYLNNYIQDKDKFYQDINNIRGKKD